MENTLQITNGKITLNGAPMHCVKDFGLRTLDDYPCTAEVRIVFDVPFYQFKPVNAKTEQPEKTNLEISLDGQTVGEIPIHQPETKLDLVKLIQFAMKGVEHEKFQLKMNPHVHRCYRASCEKQLNDYKDELDREYSRLTNG